MLGAFEGNTTGQTQESRLRRAIGAVQGMKPIGWIPCTAPIARRRRSSSGLTRCVALEGAEHGISCNAVCPGIRGNRQQLRRHQADRLAGIRMSVEEYRTLIAQTLPQKRFLKPAEIGRCVAFSCREEAFEISAEDVLGVAVVRVAAAVEVVARSACHATFCSAGWRWWQWCLCSRGAGRQPSIRTPRPSPSAVVAIASGLNSDACSPRRPGKSDHQIKKLVVQIANLSIWLDCKKYPIANAASKAG